LGKGAGNIPFAGQPGCLIEAIETNLRNNLRTTKRCGIGHEPTSKTSVIAQHNNAIAW
jgi:hypothetical protein